jgi:hypothetical protein
VFAKAREALEPLAARAKAEEAAGRLSAAIAAYERAPTWLTLTEPWKQQAAPELTRLRGLQRDADLFTCLAPEVQWAADRGDVARVQALLGQIPSGRRGALADEVAWARAHRVGGKADEGLEIRGFTPGRVELKGEHCTVDGALGQASTSELISDLDRMAARAAKLFGDEPPRLRIRVVGASDPVVAPAEREVVVYQRADEDAGALGPRVRFAVATALVGALSGAKSERWLRRATARWLASLGPAGLAPAGEAWRRVFCAAPPEGGGDGLLAAAKGEDARGDRAWALVFFCLSSQEASAADLRLALKAALAGKRALLTWATPLKASGLEPVWVETLRSP